MHSIMVVGMPKKQRDTPPSSPEVEENSHIMAAGGTLSDQGAASRSAACLSSIGQDERDRISWEETPCPLCESNDDELVLSVLTPPDGQACRLVRCRRCGLGYVNPRPDEASIGHFYPNDYAPYQTRTSPRLSQGGHFRRRLARLVGSTYYPSPASRPSGAARMIAGVVGWWLHPGRDSFTAIPFHGEGRLLDFGCGSGWFAHRMRERGWNVTGLDFNPQVAHEVTSRFGIPVLVGTLPHPQIPDESFDVITMGGVLEHVHRPHRVIEAAARALRPGGLLAIAVPNWESWGFRRFGAAWWPLDLPRHLLHFGASTLSRLVQAHGFEVLELRMLGRTSWMQRTLANLCKRGGSASHRVGIRLAATRTVCSLITRWSVWSRQADCFMLLARCGKSPSAGEAPPSHRHSPEISM